MDIDTLQTLLGSYWIYATAITTIASAICSMTPTPKEGTMMAKVYKIIDLAAINIGKAKDK